MPSSRDVAFTLIIFLVIVKILLSREIKNSQDEIEPYNQIAINILQKMDLQADPCEDFYKFACGKAKKSITTELSELIEKRMYTLLEAPIEQDDLRPFVFVKSMYQACMNTSKIKEDLEHFNSVEGWPVIEGVHWNETSFSWEDKTHKFMLIGFEFDVLFRFSATKNVVNPSEISLILNVPKLLSLEFKLENVSKASQYLQEVMDFNDQILEISEKVSTDVNEPDAVQYDSMMIWELQIEYPYVDWLNYINKRLHPIKKMNKHDIVNVESPHYFRELGNLLKITPKRTIANYMYLKAVENLDLDSYGNSESCIIQANKLRAAFSALYVKNFFNEEIRENVLELSENIRHQIIELLSKADWMDEINKEKSIKKVTELTMMIGYPDELMDADKLEDYYKDLIIDPFQNYFVSILHITIFNCYIDRMYEYNQIFDLNLPKVNAYYQPSTNHLEIPAGIIQGEFYSQMGPQYMNYGALGSTIGHELTHGLVNIGHELNEVLDINDSLQNHTKQMFLQKVQCIIDQYSSIVEPTINLTLNGYKTQEEDIADNAGYTEAYLAYMKWSQEHEREQQLPGLPYTPEQMFWISAAHTWCDVNTTETLKLSIKNDEHSIAYYRVNVPFSNSELFSNDFHCTIDSRMNPKQKCQLL